MTLFRTIQLGCTVLVCVGFVGAQHKPKAYLLPTTASTSAFEIRDRSLIEMDQIRGDWAHLTYDDREGWVEVGKRHWQCRIRKPCPPAHDKRWLRTFVA